MTCKNKICYLVICCLLEHIWIIHCSMLGFLFLFFNISWLSFQVCAGYWYEHSKGPGTFVISPRTTELVSTLRGLVKTSGDEDEKLEEGRAVLSMTKRCLSFWIHFAQCPLVVLLVCRSTLILHSYPFGPHFQWQAAKPGEWGRRPSNSV